MLSSGRNRLIRVFQGQQAGLEICQAQVSASIQLFKNNVALAIIPPYVSTAFHQPRNEASPADAAKDGVWLVTHL